MTALLYIATGLIGVILTVAAIGIYHYISDCIEESREEKIRETLEKMKEAKDIEDFKNGNFIISDGYIEIMGVVSSMDQLPHEGKRYGEAYILSGNPYNIMIWTKNISTQKIGWIKLTI